MKLLITSFVILFGLMSPSFSEEIKDVGLICESNRVEKTERPLPFWFIGNKRLERYFRDTEDIDNDGDNVEFFVNQKVSEKSRVITNDSQITIYYLKKDGKIDYNFYIKINRFDLTMKKTLFSTDDWYECELFREKKLFENGLREVENKIKNSLKKRKI